MVESSINYKGRRVKKESTLMIEDDNSGSEE